ncbi:MAG TPA: hydrogenase maturation protease [Bacteroidota bacterium]|nr:hydrogenase maturation protease [Bacteroidota bacterium]
MSHSLAIIGLGNEMLSDDGLGIRVVRALRQRLRRRDIEFEELSLGGLPLLDHLIGFDRCIIVDAISTGLYPPGTTLRLVQTGSSAPVAIRSSHQIDLSQILGLAELLGERLPREVAVYGIEACDVTTFHDDCTSAVAAAIPSLVDAICRDIEKNRLSAPPGQWQLIDPVVEQRHAMEHL